MNKKYFYKFKDSILIVMSNGRIRKNSKILVKILCLRAVVDNNLPRGVSCDDFMKMLGTTKLVNFNQLTLLNY